MSAETKSALDAALDAHLQDVCGSAITTGYVLHAAYVNTDTDANESTGYLAEFSERIPYHVGLGLAHQMVQHYATTWTDDDEE